MITLRKTSRPLGLAIGPAEETEELQATQATDLIAEAEAIVAAAEPLIAAAREILAAQARLEVDELREELGEAKAMIADLEHMLEEQRPISTPRPVPPSEPITRRVVRRVQRSFERRLPVLSPRARQVLDKQEPLFIDYETTGLSKRDKIVEVCVMDGAGRVLLSTLINPERHIPADATAVNGISDGDVIDAPTWEEVAPDLEKLLTGRTVVAHNASFEAKYTPKWGIKWVCSKKLADEALGKAPYMAIAHNKLRGGSLEARMYQCKLPPGPEHTAAGDCISTLRLLRYLAGYSQPVDLIY
jgi:hypothetical protein